MEDQFAPPFSMKDFHRYLEKDQCDENSCFYSTLKTYERLCETIPSQHLYHANQSLDTADQLQLDKARRMMAALIDRFFIIGAEKELNVPANLLKPLLSQVNEKHNIHPEVFQGVLENIFAMLRLSSFPNFYKEASMKGALRPKVTVLQILEDQCRPPMSFNDFYQFLKREHSEENIEFYKALKEYKQICIDIPAEVLKNSDILVSDIVVQDNLIKAKDKLLFIMNTFFEEQSKYDLNVPVLLKKPFFSEVNVKKNIHPDVFDGILQNVLAMLKLSSFPNFQKEVEKTQKSLQETAEDISQITPTVSLSPSLVAPPLLNRKTKSNVSFNSTISPKPDIRLSIKSLLNPTLRPQSVSGSSSSCGHEKAVSPRDTEFTPKINIQEVLEDEFLPPFSLKGSGCSIQFFSKFQKYRFR
ncbi:RGS domain-containing protein [Obelidium mucronatum]|nr:RGS domain-containing protein [Obelidium mucronatum]